MLKYLFLLLPFAVQSQWTLVDDVPYVSTQLHFAQDGSRFVSLQQGYLLSETDTLKHFPVHFVNECGFVGFTERDGVFYCHISGTDWVQRVIAWDSLTDISDTILEVPYTSPSTIHRGGSIVLHDSLLYSGFGYGTEYNNAQAPDDYRGKIIVTNLNSMTSWTYAEGLRNPFRMAYDPIYGGLWCADVGSSIAEEVNYVLEGDNMGWPCVEGDSIILDTCGETILPVYWYYQDQPRYIIGGQIFNHHYYWADAGSGMGGYIDSLGNNYPLLYPRDLTSMAINPANGRLYCQEWIGKIYIYDELPLAIGDIPEEPKSDRDAYLEREWRRLMFQMYGDSSIGIDGRIHREVPTIPGVYYKIAESRYILIP